jgi:hypothetical protein
VPIQGHGIDWTHRSCNISAQVRKTLAWACSTCNPDGNPLKYLSSRLAREALFFLRPIGTHEKRSAKRGVALSSDGTHDLDAGYGVQYSYIHQRKPNLK